MYTFLRVIMSNVMSNPVHSHKRLWEISLGGISQAYDVCDENI